MVPALCAAILRRMRPSALLLAALLLGCSSGETKPAPSAVPSGGVGAAEPAPGGAAAAAGAGAIDRKPAAEFSGDEAGARKLLAKLLDGSADRMALTLALRPDPADYAAVFEGDAVAKAQESYAKVWASFSSEAVIAPKEGQTELKLSSATAEDFAADNDKGRDFPGGYRKVADKLKKGVIFYRWKFVKPGESLGMAFDGLTFVNGHWAWFPKPWRAVRGEGGEGEHRRQAE